MASAANEAGLYTLILRCHDAMTAGTRPYRFRKWITSEVLPAIRRTGRYEHKEMSRKELVLMALDAEEERERIEAERKRLQAYAEKIEPDAEVGRRLGDSEEDFKMTDVAKSLGMSAIALNRILHQKRVIFRQGNCWYPYARYENGGYFRLVAAVIESGGEKRTRHQLRVTPKGRRFIFQQLCQPQLPLICDLSASADLTCLGRPREYMSRHAR